jgi:lipoate-protein ligase B
MTITEGAGLGLRPLRVVDLGTIAYNECWDLQRQFVSQIAQGTTQETLLLLEHPHTYTCGRGGGRDHILITEHELQRRGITVLDVDRGGDVTYHGPGQLVAYPHINLLRDAKRVDYRQYLRSLEDVLIRTLADFGIQGHRLEGFSGVWVTVGESQEKIAAIGVKVDGRGITSHGIALNVDTDLAYFSYIVPCGITDKGVTSMSKLLSDPPTMNEVKLTFTRHFMDVFGF